MEIQQLRVEVKRLTHVEDIKGFKEVLDLYNEFLYQAILNHADDEVKNIADREAKIVLQMVLTKSLNIRSSIDGLEFTSKTGGSLKNIIDPTIIASNLRALFEMIAMFNVINRQPGDAETKKFVHQLWVHAGLKFRQRFEHTIISDYGQNKFEKESEELNELRSGIENSELYLSLDEINQKRIQQKLKEKDYKITLEDGQVTFFSWQDLCDKMGFKKNLFQSLYTYFSLYAHPSNVSVFQFREMFKEENPHFINKAKFNFELSTYLISCFIADYIEVFPKVKDSFEKLSLRDQIVINYNNVLARSDDYSINDCLKELG